ncbi:MAG TPA: SDR family NAD(P)-dependent oxidoreductase, partial [Longilinea sp.]|nr:SDR family NAD(P)-dependent oxidoreductase [Longilinea sp.]
MTVDITNKTYVVTGATSGIGYATVQQLACAGASVIGVGRSTERGLEAEMTLQKSCGNVRVKYLTADLSQQAEVRRLADQIRDLLAEWNTTALDGLVNNAGAFTYWLTLTPDGIETQWAVNHLAPFLLTNLLLPQLQAAADGRVVTVSSDSHFGAHIRWDDPQLRRRYSGLGAYGVTKLANILFTAGLNTRAALTGVRAFAADPGLVKTDIGMKGTPRLVSWVWKIRRSGGTSAEVPAQSIFYLLTEPSLMGTRE